MRVLIMIAASFALAGCWEVKQSRHEPAPLERELTKDEKARLIAAVAAQTREPPANQFEFPLLSKVKYGRLPDWYCFSLNEKNQFGSYTGFHKIMAELTYDSDENFKIRKILMYGDFCK